MTRPLRVLLVEDSETDAKLVVVALRSSGHELAVERVQEADAMRAALAKQAWDVVLSDWSMPKFSALGALAVLKESRLDLPFIIVSGTVGEEVAVEAMRAGAHDYVLKDKLARLGPAVERETRERAERAAHRAAEEELRAQSARFRALIEQSTEGISLADEGARLFYVSPGGKRILGIDEATRPEIIFAVHPDDRERVAAPSARVRAAPSAVETTECRVVRPDGTTRWVEITLANHLGNPAVHAVVGNFRDVTERRLAVDALRESELRFRSIWEAGLVGIGVTDGVGGYADANDALLEMIGYTRADLDGGRVRWNEMTPPAWEHATARVREQLPLHGRVHPFEKEYVRKDGTRAPVLVGIAALSEQRNISVVVDLTKQKTADAARRESETRFRRLWETGVLGIAITDMSGGFIDANDALLTMLGYARDDLVSGQVRWTEITAPESRESTARATAQVRAEGSAPAWEKEYLRGDGTRVSALVAVASLADGRNLTVISDLSGQKKAERALHDVEAQLRQAQKMEAIGRLAGGVAHDFNNMLSVILSYAELTLAELKDGDPMREDIGEICKAGTRAAELTTQLLMFSRQQVLAPKIVDLNDVLAGMDKMLRRVLGEDVSLASRPSTPLGRVEVDRSSIEQVVMNLAVNARDAMPTGGKLTIETANVVLDHQFARTHVGVRPGPHVMLAVTDTGTGMDRATQARIFEPFFTTKGVGKGTGLGLSTVFGIVSQSGGTVWVYSELGIGTTFKVYLPIVDGDVTVRPATLAPASLRGSETILLVEDEEAVRVVACGILQRAGYHVLEARSPEDALLRALGHAGTIHLLLTDVVMPGMSGPALAKRLTATRPETKVLCMSGYTDDSVVRHGVLEAEIEYLQKPLTPDTLRRKVREVLDAPARA